MIACLVAFGLPAAAQVPHATLLGWQAKTDRTLRDRSHNTGGLFYDRGLWRAVTPAMDPEYHIDLFGLGLSPTEEYDQIEQSEFGTGYVGWMGSIEQARFATAHDLRVWERVAGRAGVVFEGGDEATFRRDGGVSTLGLDVLLGPRDSLGQARPDGPRVGFRQTFARFKPDLDFTLRAAAGGLPTGRVELAAHALDFANNTIFVTRGAGRPLNDTIRAYERAPAGLRASVASPPLPLGAWSARGELVGGLSTRSRARVSVRSTGRAFGWWDEAQYAGALAEVGRAWGDLGLSVGLVARGRWSAVGRDEGGAAFTSRQRERAGGVFALARWPGWMAEAWVEQGSYRDEQDGTDFAASSVPSALDYRADLRWVRLRLGRTPPKGLRLDLRYLAHDRYNRSGFEGLSRYLSLYPSFARNLGGFQHRVSGGIGYSFRPGTWFMVGSNVDLDLDLGTSDGRRNVYDGGYGQIVFAL